MEEINLAGKVQTVLGQINPENLGITLCHEHLLIDFLAFCEEPERAFERKMAQEPVKLENLWWVRQNLFTNLDNVRMIDKDLAIREANRFKEAGGGTIVELTNIGIGRDPQNLALISRTTGLNIIMGSGYYVGSTQSEKVRKMNNEQLADVIVKDIIDGVNETDIRAGIIGEIGVSVPIDEFEIKSLQSAAIAQKKTGAPINIHPSHSDNLVLENIKILKEAGADLNRVVISHCDSWSFTYDILKLILDEGCYVEFDCFGYDGYFPMYQGRHFHMPSDAQRIKTLLKLINEGFLKKLLIAGDHCVKTSLTEFGGYGYDHIIRNVIPLMMRYGIKKDQILEVLISNPKEILTFKKI